MPRADALELAVGGMIPSPFASLHPAALGVLGVRGVCKLSAVRGRLSRLSHGQQVFLSEFVLSVTPDVCRCGKNPTPCLVSPCSQMLREGTGERGGLQRDGPEIIWVPLCRDPPPSPPGKRLGRVTGKIGQVTCPVASRTRGGVWRLGRKPQVF